MLFSGCVLNQSNGVDLALVEPFLAQIFLLLDEEVRVKVPFLRFVGVSIID